MSRTMAVGVSQECSDSTAGIYPADGQPKFNPGIPYGTPKPAKSDP